MNKLSHHKIAVVGGGPAGAAAALFLSQAGFDVCVFERKIFPREVICGEFLSGEVADILKQMNLFDEFNALNPVKINSFRAINEKGKEISAKINFQSYAIKRSVFDNFLIKAVKETGAIVYQPAEVKSIEMQNQKYLLKIKTSQSEFDISADFVISAYGRQSILDEKLNRNFVHVKSGFNGVKFHVPNKYFTKSIGGEIRIYSGRGIYCGLNMVSGSETTLCYLEKQKNNNSGTKKSLLSLCQSNKSFKALFNENIQEIISGLKAYGTGNIYFGRRNVVENGIFMIGDAAGVIAPLAGDGIAMALQSARLISSLLVQYNCGEINYSQLTNLYSKKWRRLFLKRLRTALLIQNIILHRKSRTFLQNTTAMFPSLLPKIINATRGF